MHHHSAQQCFRSRSFVISGITPVSVAGGSVKVKDKLRIGFTIVAAKKNS
jgi:hypothetical protein